MQEKGHKEQLRSSIAKALLYSDIFSYPLTANEILQRLSTNHTSLDEIQDTLGAMKNDGTVFQFDEYFALRNEQDLALRRNTGNELARNVLPRALRRGRLLYAFPFIRAVMIAGSLSKNYMDNDSDVDYFVITEPGRLWVSRFLVALFKRLFFFNSRKMFCVNYYIDYEHLEIEEKNIFTATELATLILVCGGQYYERLMQQNQWLMEYFPNYIQPAPDERTLRGPLLKRLLEITINPIGDWLDTVTFRLASRRYIRLYGHMFSKEDFNVAFKSRKDVSKNHNQHFQKHITELYNSKVERFVNDRPKHAVS